MKLSKCFLCFYDKGILTGKVLAGAACHICLAATFTAHNGSKVADEITGLETGGLSSLAAIGTETE